MTFLEEVKSLLSQAQRKPVAIPKEVLKLFLKDCKDAVEKQFTQERESEFRIRMSSIGKTNLSITNGKNTPVVMLYNLRKL